MQYKDKELKPIKDYLAKQDHGIKKSLAEYIGVRPQQLSFYFKFKEIPPSKFLKMKEFVKLKLN